jgi:hypothetical protein
VGDHISESGPDPLVILKRQADPVKLLLGPAPASERAVRDQGARPLGPRRCEQGTRRTTLRKAEQRRPLGADRVEHRPDVRDALLERGHVRNRIGEAGSGLVIQDQPREGGEPLEEAAEAQVRPLQVEMRDETGDDDEVRPTISDDLVRDAYLASLDIPRLRLLHEQSLGLAATFGS